MRLQEPSSWYHPVFGGNLSPDPVAPPWVWAYLGQFPCPSLLTEGLGLNGSKNSERQLQGQVLRARVRDLLGFPLVVCGRKWDR